MATIKSILALEDKMTPTLSKAEKQAIANINAYNKLTNQVQMLKDASDKLVESGLGESKMFDDITNTIESLENTMVEYEDGVRNAQDANGDLKMSIIAANQALELLNKGWQVFNQLIQEANEWMELNNTQFDSEYTLAMKMHTVLGATNEEIQSMYDYTAALQQNGIIGDEILNQGAKQLALSASSVDSLKKLTKAAADVAVAEYGIQNAASGYTSISHYMQRALEGSASMFVRNGVLTKKEAAYIDSLSDKTAKENALLKAFNKYLDTNSKAAKTAQGQIKQMDNAMSDTGETLGKKVTPYFAQFKQILVSLVQPIADFIVQNEWLIPVIEGVGFAIGAFITILTTYIAVSKLAEIAAYALGVAEGVALWPILLIIVAIGVLIGVLIHLWNTNDKVAEALVFAWDVARVGLGVAVSGIKGLWLALVAVIGGVVDAILHHIQNLVNKIIDAANIAIDIGNAFGGNKEHIQHKTFADNFTKGLTDYTDYLSEDLSDYWNKNVLDKATEFNDTRASRVENRNKITPIEDISDTFNNLLTDVTGNDNLDDLIGTDSSGGKALKTTTNDDLLSDEDIQLLLDVATRDYKLNYQQITPNITLTFGDIRETADVEDILDKVADKLEEIYEGNLEVNPT